MTPRPGELGARNARPAERETTRQPVQSMHVLHAACIGLMLVAVGRIVEIVPALNGLPLARIALVLAILGVALSYPVLKTTNLASLSLARVFAGFIALCALSFVFSIWKSESLRFITSTLPVLAALYYLVCKSIVDWTSARRILFAFVLCGISLSIATLVSYRGGRAEVSDFLDTNDLAYLQVTLLPIALAFAMTSRGPVRIAFICAAAAMGITALLTQSRGGLFGLLAIAMYVVFVGLDPAPTLRRQAGWFVARGLAVVVAGVLVWSALPSETRQRLATISDIESDYNVTGDDRSGRMMIWKRNMAGLMRRPIGFGVATFIEVDGRHGGPYRAPHNAFVQVAVELGVLGGALFLALHILAWRGLSAILRGSKDAPTTSPSPSLQCVRIPRPYLHALRAALIGNFTCAMFLSQGYSFTLVTLLGIVSGLLLLVRMNDQPAKSETRIRKGFPRPPKSLRSGR